jgi:hypothetical protein
MRRSAIRAAVKEGHPLCAAACQLALHEPVAPAACVHQLLLLPPCQQRGSLHWSAPSGCSLPLLLLPWPPAVQLQLCQSTWAAPTPVGRGWGLAAGWPLLSGCQLVWGVRWGWWLARC